jgi:hypothetical protein
MPPKTLIQCSTLLEERFSPLASCSLAWRWSVNHKSRKNPRVINPKAAPRDEATIRSIPTAANCAASEKPLVLLATILASRIAYIDESAINIAADMIKNDCGELTG